MTISLAQGSQVAIAETYGSPFNVTAITNAAEAVATVQAGHGLAPNDIIEFTSGWDYANGRILRVKTVVSNDVTLEGFDTQNTTDYPSGSGVGTLRKITAWQSITQIQSVSSTASAPDKVDITTLANKTRKFKPGLGNYPDLTMTVFYDRALAWVAPALLASRRGTDIAIRIIPPGGNKIYGNGTISLTPSPQLATGQAITMPVSYFFNADQTDYAS
jgi:hypothetical protein